MHGGSSEGSIDGGCSLYVKVVHTRPETNLTPDAVLSAIKQLCEEHGAITSTALARAGTVAQASQPAHAASDGQTRFLVPQTIDTVG